MISEEQRLTSPEGRPVLCQPKRQQNLSIAGQHGAHVAYYKTDVADVPNQRQSSLHQAPDVVVALPESYYAYHGEEVTSEANFRGRIDEIKKLRKSLRQLRGMLSMAQCTFSRTTMSDLDRSDPMIVD